MSTQAIDYYDSDAICEALARHVEVMGAECMDRHLLDKNGNATCTIWCVVGPNAQQFKEMAEKWLKDRGFKHEEG